MPIADLENDSVRATIQTIRTFQSVAPGLLTLTDAASQAAVQAALWAVGGYAPPPILKPKQEKVEFVEEVWEDVEE